MTEQFLSVYNEQIYNPQCFLLYGNTPEISFLDLKDVGISIHSEPLLCSFFQLNFTFINNSALQATAIFMLSALQCSNINSAPYFDAASILKWPFLNIR